jgi:1-acyl-sn-glycerol-3-phosphate acyltransferase
VPRRALEPSYRLAIALLRPLLMVVTKRDWRGAENLPDDGGFIVCSNHMSYLDAFTLAHFLIDNGHPPYFLAKESVFRIPLVGRIVRGAGQIPVRRETGDAGLAFAAAVVAVREGRCIAMYPEGTLTRDPQLWPMVAKTGAARLALTTGSPVVPVAQWGPQDVLAPYAFWPRLLPRKTMHIVAGPPVDLSDLQGRPLEPVLLRQATARIMDAVTALLEPLRGATAPVVRFDSRALGLPPTGNPARALGRRVRRSSARLVRRRPGRGGAGDVARPGDAGPEREAS